jgi:hypothetical protein
MRACRIAVTYLFGTLILVPMMLAHAQASNASKARYGPNASVCGTPRFDFWYGYYYYPVSKSLAPPHEGPLFLRRFLTSWRRI